MSRSPALSRAVYLATGSSIERLIRCASSIGLPHVNFETEHSERGRAIHRYLEMCAVEGGNRDIALAAVPDEWRAACEQLDLTGLDSLFELTAEIAFAYDVENDTARELGRGAGRVYDDVKETEIPCMLDVVGVHITPELRRGLYVDWKTGWLTRRKKVSEDWQMKFGALCVARRFDLDEVEVQLINVSEGKPYVRRQVYNAAALARIATEIRGFYGIAVEVRERYRAGKLPERFELGEWCEHCPSKLVCPAQLSLVRGALERKVSDISQLDDEQLADLWRRAKNVRKLLGALIQQIEGQVGAPGRGPLFLGEDHGKHRWLVKEIAEGNEMVDGPVTYEVVKEVLGEKYAKIAAPPDASKKGIGIACSAALKDHVIPKGKKEKTEEAILKRIREKNGVRRKEASPKVKEIVVDVPLPGAPLPDDIDALPAEDLPELAPPEEA